MLYLGSRVFRVFRVFSDIMFSDEGFIGLLDLLFHLKIHKLVCSVDWQKKVDNHGSIFRTFFPQKITFRGFFRGISW
jgi:hypothetical protein